MTALINATTCPEAWVKACTHLVANCPKNEDRNIVLDISNPAHMTPQDISVYNLVDKFHKDHGSKSVATVTNTIFPSYLYKNGGADRLFSEYPKIIGRFPKPDIGGWGTYACRMMHVKDTDGNYINPLKKIIDKINDYFKPGGARYSKCYELGMLRFDGDIQLYDLREDRGRTIGGPCLSHISVKVRDGAKIDLTALYRNHFYVEKLFGNLIGLAQLQDFIAKETKMQSGSLVVHSTSAELDTGKWKTSEVKALIVEAQKALAPPSAKAV